MKTRSATESLVLKLIYSTKPVIDLFETHGLVVSSGHKAGLILISLPIESASTEGRALSTEWIITHWAKWIYPECNVEDVHILDEYVATPIE
ncbi:Imm45 family immunity protein [Pantoea sp. ACRSH]|uniref:Imm45 family immunity protein n=1 Tax=Pantoea sp. ACRSH TaxID=2918210 RepID=UPI002814D0AF|nr:Imm45 family immunity protein [Pantoea sp. ACRSH]